MVRENERNVVILSFLMTQNHFLFMTLLFRDLTPLVGLPSVFFCSGGRKGFT